MFEKLKGFVQYAAKAVWVAVGPAVIALVDSLVVEMGSIVQAALSALAASFIVYWVPNKPAA